MYVPIILVMYMYVLFILDFFSQLKQNQRSIKWMVLGELNLNTYRVLSEIVQVVTHYLLLSYCPQVYTRGAQPFLEVGFNLDLTSAGDHIVSLTDHDVF